MARITKTFEYSVTDDYLEDTFELRRTAAWTYKGPDKIWVELDPATNTLYTPTYKTKEEDGDIYPVTEGYERLCVDCGIDPLFCTLIGASVDVDYSTLPQHSEVLPNGNTYERPDPQTPDHVFDMETAVYNPDDQSWSYGTVQTWVTWDEIIANRDAALEIVTQQINNLGDMPSSLRDTLVAYKTDLENLEATWEGYPAYKVQLPDHPVNG